MLQEFVPDGETPTPGLVGAWLALDTLHAESVPMWAANWLVQGYDGESLAELPGLSGRDTLTSETSFRRLSLTRALPRCPQARPPSRWHTTISPTCI